LKRKISEGAFCDFVYTILLGNTKREAFKKMKPILTSAILAETYFKIYFVRFNIFIAFKYFYTYTLRPRDCLSGELPPGRRISTGGILLF
jgi:hypothetical protein